MASRTKPVGQGSHEGVAAKEKKQGRPPKEESLKYRQRSFELLLTGKELTVETLRAELKVSAKTARRLLTMLEDSCQRLVRTQRGLRIGGPGPYYFESLARSLQEKEAIGSKLVEVSQGERSVACGPGTTVVVAARKQREAGNWPVLVTSNMGAIGLVGERSPGIIELVGGTYDVATHAVVGSAAEGFERSKCEAAVIGVSGIDAEGGLHVAHSSERPVLVALLKSATSRIYVLFDHSKLLRMDTFRVATIQSLLEEVPGRTVHLITNALPPGDKRRSVLAKFAQMNGVKVYYADPV